MAGELFRSGSRECLIAVAGLRTATDPQERDVHSLYGVFAFESPKKGYDVFRVEPISRSLMTPMTLFTISTKLNIAPIVAGAYAHGSGAKLARLQYHGGHLLGLRALPNELEHMAGMRVEERGIAARMPVTGGR